MKADKKSTDRVQIGSIVQVSPTSGTDWAGRCGAVVEKLSWGAKVHFGLHDGSAPIAWDALEPTGGVAVWDQMGQPFKKPEEPLRHHP